MSLDELKKRLAEVELHLENVDECLARMSERLCALEKRPGARMKRPALDEVKAYCKERGNTVDPNRFFDHYEANGWKVGKNGIPMANWQAAVRTWEAPKTAKKPWEE